MNKSILKVPIFLFCFFASILTGCSYLPFHDYNIVKKIMEANHIPGKPEDIASFGDMNGGVFLLKIDGRRFDVLPDETGSLGLLEYLYIDGTDIKEFPESMKNLKSLKKLHIRKSPITGFPKNMKLDSLEELEIVDCPVREFPGPVPVFKNLKVLTIYKTPLDRLSQSFSSFEKLNEMSLGDNEFTEIPASLFALKNLKKLEFWNIEKDAPIVIPENIPAGPLESLSIFGNFKNVPESITNLHNLRYLELKGKLETIPGEIYTLTGLKSLVLNDNKIRFLPAGISKLTNLRRLELGGNKLTRLPEDLFIWKEFAARLKNGDAEIYVDFNRLLDLPQKYRKWLYEYLYPGWMDKQNH